MALREGMSARDVVCDIIRRNPRILSIRLAIYKQGPLPFVDPSVKAQAKRLRRQLRLHGYWPSILAVCWRNDRLKKQLVNAIRVASRHEVTPGVSREFMMHRGQTNRATLEGRIQSLQPTETLVVTSRIRLANRAEKHLPMMDFACYDSQTDLRKLILALNEIGQREGVILRSGNSFHYYGFKPLTHRQWLEFLGKCLLLTPITDARYVAHRLMDGVCTLRISSKPPHRNEPTIAAILT